MGSSQQKEVCKYVGCRNGNGWWFHPDGYTEMAKEIIILGAIGNTARQNRDNMRVLDGGVRCMPLNPTFNSISRWY